MDIKLSELCQVFMFEASRLAEGCFSLLERLDEKPPERRFRKRHRIVRIASEVAKKKLPMAIVKLEKHGCIIDREKGTTWKIYIDNKRKNYPKIGVIKPKTGKLEILEKADGRIRYRTCTLKELLAAKKRGGIE